MKGGAVLKGNRWRKVCSKETFGVFGQNMGFLVTLTYTKTVARDLLDVIR